MIRRTSGDTLGEMGDVQAGTSDVPSECTRCEMVTLHRPSSDGKLHCLACLAKAARPNAGMPSAGPESWDVVEPNIKVSASSIFKGELDVGLGPAGVLHSGDIALECSTCGVATLHRKGPKGVAMWCVPCLQTRPKGTVKPHPSTAGATTVQPQNGNATPTVSQPAGGWGSTVRNLVAAALIIAGITTYAIHRKTTNDHSPKDISQEQPPPIEAAPVAPAPTPTPQDEDQTLSIVRACGRPTRDYEDNQAGTTWRHLVYGRHHVELVYQRACRCSGPVTTRTSAPSAWESNRLKTRFSTRFARSLAGLRSLRFRMIPSNFEKCGSVVAAPKWCSTDAVFV